MPLRRPQHHSVPGADKAARGYLEDYPRRGGGALQDQRAARRVCAGDGGAPETADPEQELTLEQAAHRALELTGQGFGPTAAAKAAAQGTPYSKSEVYKQLLVLQQGQQAGE